MRTEILTVENIELVNDFCCDKEGIDNYLKEQAIKDNLEQKSTTTLIIRKYKGVRKLIGFYTLKNTSLIFEPDNKIRGYPAVELMYLAIDKRYQRKGIGSKVLKKIIYKSILYSTSFSAILLIVLSSEIDSVGFYKKYSFDDLPVYHRLLYDPCRERTKPLFLNLLLEE